MENSHVTLKNLFSLHHCHGNVNKDFSKTERRELLCYHFGQGSSCILAGQKKVSPKQWVRFGLLTLLVSEFLSSWPGLCNFGESLEVFV